MRSRLICLIYSICMVLPGMAADTLRVLVIGNSFSVDAVEQELWPLAHHSGMELCIGSLYRGGCSLREHAVGLQRGDSLYSYRLIADGRRRVRDSVTLREALHERRWDIVTLQQVSDLSGVTDSLAPWLTILIDSIRVAQPAARLAWHRTWAYDVGARHPGFARYANDQRTMDDSIARCTAHLLEAYPIDLLIPVGEAVQRARRRARGGCLTRDGYHLRYDYGRYLAACVWFEALTGVRPRSGRYDVPWYGSQYEPEPRSARAMRQVRTAATQRRCRRDAHRAVKK